MFGVVIPGVAFPPPTSFKPKSRAFPTLSTNPNIWAFVQHITNEIDKIDFDNQFTNNLSKKQRQALTSLQNHPWLMVKPADKVGNVVVMNVETYERMCLDILDNKDWYRPISKQKYLELPKHQGTKNPYLLRTA